MINIIVKLSLDILKIDNIDAATKYCPSTSV